MDLDNVYLETYKANNISLTDIINPLNIDNRSQVSVPEDQNANPICACVSVGNLIESIIWKKTGHLINIDSKRIYDIAKEIDGRPTIDGTDLASAIKAVSKLLNYEITYKIFNRCDNNIEQIKHLIHKYGFTLGGFNITAGWMECDDKSPIIKKSDIVCGNHAVLICGYDKQGLYIQNSYGKEWGHKGFGILPWSIFNNEVVYLCCVDSIKKDGVELDSTPSSKD